MMSSENCEVSVLSVIRYRWSVAADNGLRTTGNYANFEISILGSYTSFDFCSASQVMGLPV